MAGGPFNLDQMRPVRRIDEQRSCSRAATALGNSQSAVSQQVHGIEACKEQAKPAASKAVAAFCALVRQAALLTAGQQPSVSTPVYQPA